MTERNGIEARLLCGCAGGRWSPAEETELEEILCGQLDWERVFALGRRHRMLPFLRRSLKGMGEERLPQEVREQLKLAYEQNAAWNLLMTAALVRLLKALGSGGIDAIAFKGPVTSFALYGDLGLRGFTDIDLIVPGDDFHRTRSVLQELGLHPEVRLSERQARALVHFRNELTFSAQDQSFHVDLHWKLLVHHLRMLPDEEGVWERSVMVNLAGVKVRTLGTEDLLSYFCARAAVDSWTTLYRICDIAEAVRAAREGGLVDALDRARQVRKKRLMLVGLLMAHDLLDVPIPGKVIEEARELSAVVGAAAKGCRAMFRLDGVAPGLLRRDMSLLSVLDTPGARLRFAAFLPLGPGPNDIKLVELPQRLWFLYRLIRVVRASLKWIGESIR